VVGGGNEATAGVAAVTGVTSVSLMDDSMVRGTAACQPANNIARLLYVVTRTTTITPTQLMLKAERYGAWCMDVPLRS
jgi:hypothetical protein